MAILQWQHRRLIRFDQRRFAQQPELLLWWGRLRVRRAGRQSSISSVAVRLVLIDIGLDEGYCRGSRGVGFQDVKATAEVLPQRRQNLFRCRQHQIEQQQSGIPVWYRHWHRR